jgi:hypothetical protein
VEYVTIDKAEVKSKWVTLRNAVEIRPNNGVKFAVSVKIIFKTIFFYQFVKKNCDFFSLCLLEQKLQYKFLNMRKPFFNFATI